MLRDSYG